MKKPASLCLFCLSLSLAACGDKPSEPAPIKPADLQSHFPNFTAVTVPGEVPQFYIDLNTVKSLNNDLLQFKIVRLADQGYVIQDAISNCQDSVQTLDGILYKANGSLDKPFTGDAQPMPYANQASLAALVKQACGKKTVFSVQPTRIADTAPTTQPTPATTEPSRTPSKPVNEPISQSTPLKTEQTAKANPSTPSEPDTTAQPNNDSNPVNVPKADTDTKPSTSAVDTQPTTTKADNKAEENPPDIANLDSEVIAGCDAQMQTAGAAVECMKGNLQTQKDRLNNAYKIRHDVMSTEAQQRLEQTQKTWLDTRNATCGKLTDETPAADAMAMLNCIYKAVKQRADEIEQMPIPKAATNDIKANKPKEADNANVWYKVKAKPNLVVRKQADITSDKLGLIPQGAKVKVLETNLKKDSINGWDGSWVKIQYQDQEGYVFDAFIEKLK